MRLMGLMAVLALVLGTAGSASAQDTGAYIAPKAGFTYLMGEIEGDSEGKGQLLLGLAVGYDFMPNNDYPVRAELEYAWRDKTKLLNESGSYNGINYTGTGKVGAHSLFLNTYIDLHNETSVTPYIGAGLGAARVSVEADASINGVPSNLRESETNFAWNVGAGAACRVNDSVSLDLGYRYSDLGKVKVEDLLGAKVKATSHDVILGLRLDL